MLLYKQLSNFMAFSCFIKCKKKIINTAHCSSIQLADRMHLICDCLIAGNASLACKIKEIDLGTNRLGSVGYAGGSSRSSVIASTATSEAVKEGGVSAVSTGAAGAGVSAVIGAASKKRSRGVADTAIGAAQGKASIRDSTVSNAKAYRQMLQRGSSTVATIAATVAAAAPSLRSGTVPSAMGSLGSFGERASQEGQTTRGDSATGASVGASTASGSEDDAEEEGPLVKRLREEISKLMDTNKHLLMQETEIRQEISGEAARHTEVLLEQIEALRAQLDDRENASPNDVTKSCKKVRKKQQEVAQQRTVKDLRAVEEELESLRESHEQEVSGLKTQIAQLEKEVQKYCEEAKVAKSSLEALKMRMTSRTSASTNEPSEGKKQLLCNSAAAAEFSQRMQRDARFQSREESNQRTDSTASSISQASKASLSPVITEKGSPKRSPTRSPLGPLRNDPNSPIRLAEIVMPTGKAGKGSKKEKKDKKSSTEAPADSDEPPVQPARKTSASRVASKAQLAVVDANDENVQPGEQQHSKRLRSQRV